MSTSPEDRYAHVIASLEYFDDAVLLAGMDACVLYANAGAQRLYGYEPRDLPGTSMNELCAEGHAEALRGEIAASDGRPRIFRAIHRHQDGSEFLVEITVKRLDYLPPAALLLLVRECPEDTYGGDLELHSLLLQNAYDAVVAHDFEGTLLYANRQALAQWKCASVSELRERGKFSWVPPELKASIESRMAKLADKGELRFESHGTRGRSGWTYAEEYAKVIETPRGPVIVSAIRDVSERVQTEEMVRYLAYHDDLTGLANRALLGSDLAHAISQAEQHTDTVGMIFIDLDNFKPVNDRLGHATGDDVLREVANRISACVRETDTIARPGGDEFVILFPRLSRADELRAIAEKLHYAIKEPMEFAGQTLMLSASMGLAIYQRGEGADSFMTRADLAMYQARRSRTPGWEAPLD